MNRGILDVTVQVNQHYRLRLVGAHLKSRRAVPDYDQALMRAKEAWSLREHITQILATSPDTNLLLFADLNDTKNEYPVREIIGWRGTPNYMMDLWRATAAASIGLTTGRPPTSILALITSSSALLVKGDPRRKMRHKRLAVLERSSDHRAIYAVIFAADRT
jgi:hypothetical protein